MNLPETIGSQVQLETTCSKSITKTIEQSKVQNVFKVNNRNNRTTLLALVWCIYC